MGLVLFVLVEVFFDVFFDVLDIFFDEVVLLLYFGEVLVFLLERFVEEIDLFWDEVLFDFGDFIFWDVLLSVFVCVDVEGLLVRLLDICEVIFGCFFIGGVILL